MIIAIVTLSMIVPRTIWPIPAALLLEANGRNIFSNNGSSLHLFLPPETERVVIDIGAHELSFSSNFLRTNVAGCALVVIAVEPQMNLVRSWAKNNPCLIAIPAAISTKPGFMQFHVNAFDQTSSLVPSLASSWATSLTTTRHVQQVPVISLASLLRAIPHHVSITGVKLDCQGQDLHVLQSGLDPSSTDSMHLLRRAEQLRVEVILDHAQLYDTPTRTHHFVDFFLAHKAIFRVARLVSVSVGQVDVCLANQGAVENSLEDSISSRFCIFNTSRLRLKPLLVARDLHPLSSEATSHLNMFPINHVLNGRPIGFKLYRYLRRLIPNPIDVCSYACLAQPDCTGFWVFDKEYTAEPGICFTKASWMPAFNDIVRGGGGLLTRGKQELVPTDKVIAQHVDGQWYAATVIQDTVNTGTSTTGEADSSSSYARQAYTVRYDLDGVVATNVPVQVRSLGTTEENGPHRYSEIDGIAFVANSTVSARWIEDGGWYPGKVARVHENGTFTIVFADGVVEHSMPAENIMHRSVPQEAAAGRREWVRIKGGSFYTIG
jgi:FkbM family methyltransferase